MIFFKLYVKVRFRNINSNMVILSVQYHYILYLFCEVFNG